MKGFETEWNQTMEAKKGKERKKNRKERKERLIFNLIDTVPCPTLRFQSHK